MTRFLLVFITSGLLGLTVSGLAEAQVEVPEMAGRLVPALPADAQVAIDEAAACTHTYGSRTILRGNYDRMSDDQKAERLDHHGFWSERGQAVDPTEESETYFALLGLYTLAGDPPGSLRRWKRYCEAARENYEAEASEAN